jgi:hypothetical protein
MVLSGKIGLVLLSTLAFANAAEEDWELAVHLNPSSLVSTVPRRVDAKGKSTTSTFSPSTFSSPTKATMSSERTMQPADDYEYKDANYEIGCTRECEQAYVCDCVLNVKDNQKECKNGLTANAFGMNNWDRIKSA